MHCCLWHLKYLAVTFGDFQKLAHFKKVRKLFSFKKCLLGLDTPLNSLDGSFPSIQPSHSSSSGRAVPAGGWTGEPGQRLKPPSRAQTDLPAPWLGLCRTCIGYCGIVTIENGHVLAPYLFILCLLIFTSTIQSMFICDLDYTFLF